MALAAVGATLYLYYFFFYFTTFKACQDTNK